MLAMSLSCVLVVVNDVDSLELLSMPQSLVSTDLCYKRVTGKFMLMSEAFVSTDLQELIPSEFRGLC